MKKRKMHIIRFLENETVVNRMMREFGLDPEDWRISSMDMFLCIREKVRAR